MRKKNILIFSTAYFPLVGGAEVAVKKITDKIDNFNFHLITNRFARNLAKKEKVGNILVFRVGIPYWNETISARRWSNFLFIAFAFFKALQLNFRFHYKIVWPIMASYGSAPALCLKILFPWKKMVLTLQEGDAPEHILKRVSVWRYPIWKLLFKTANHIQTISEFLKHFAIQHGANYSKISIVPNGVDFIKIQNAKIKTRNDNAKFRNKLNIKSEEKIIITTSRLVYKNAIDILIEAVYRLRTADCGLPIKLLIVGDGPLRKKLESQAASRKPQPIFIGGVSPDEIYNYLAIADVFVRPSRSEGLGNSFLEAMAMGVPIIGTPVGGIPDFLRDRETGLFCEVDNPKDLAEKIKILLENKALRERLAKNGEKLVKEKYNWDTISESMKKIFASLI